MHKLNCALLSCCGRFCSEAVSLKWLSTVWNYWDHSKAAINPSWLLVIKYILLLDVYGAVVNQA